jgi:hypothetical protein
MRICYQSWLRPGNGYGSDRFAVVDQRNRNHASPAPQPRDSQDPGLARQLQFGIAQQTDFAGPNRVP